MRHICGESAGVCLVSTEERLDLLSSVIGKLCLQHEDLAKKSIPALVRELEVCEDVAVRNNVVIVMCDLCIRYTVMVDKYIPNISMCLKDSDPFIRKQTLILLTNLLQVRMRTDLSFFSLHRCSAEGKMGVA